MREKGFTLLEVLVSLAILSGILVLGYQVMTGAIAAEQRSERWTKAALLGEALMRETIPRYPDIGESGDKFPAPDDAYSWKSSVKETLVTDAREIDVTVTYRKDGEEESVTVVGIAVK